jgi:UDP-glucose 4-epimerase
MNEKPFLVDTEDVIKAMKIFGSRKMLFGSDAAVFGKDGYKRYYTLKENLCEIFRDSDIK